MSVRSRALAAVAGRTVAITGASSGIGLATALALAPGNGRLVLIARDTPRLAAAVAAVRAAGGNVTGRPVDLRDTGAATDAGRDLAGQGVDILIANAGLSIARPVLGYAERFDTLGRSAAVNYLSAVALALPVLAAMAERGGGHLIGVTSVQAGMPVPGWSAYCSSKAALDSWLRCAAGELAPHGIATTIVRFPLVDTPMIRPTYRRVPPWAMSADAAAGWMLRAIARRPAVIAPAWSRLAEVAVAAVPGTAAVLLGRASARLTPRDP